MLRNMGSISAIIYILYCLSFVLYRYICVLIKKPIWGIFNNIIIIWIGLNYLLVFVILPKFGVNLLNKRDDIIICY